MHDMMKYHDDICGMKEKLTKWLKDELDCGKEHVNTEEAGEVVDMIKDLAKVEKDCWEARYYESVVMAMHEFEEGEEDGPYGYDRYRYPSSGRFAPKGSGRRYGYIPPYMTMPFDDPMIRKIYEEDPTKDYRMGYPIESTGKDMPARDHKHGDEYNRYRAARKGYTETHSPEDKAEMNEHAKRHMADTVETIRDIWESADPDLKKKMKTDLGNLMNELS